MDAKRIGDVLRLMHDLNFRALPTKGGCRRFVGDLGCKAGEVTIELSISDWDFVDYPKIRILGRPDFLPDRMAHHVTDGSFCYLAKGEVVLDRYDPAGSILFCLNQATGLLNDLVANPSRNLSDFQAEFQAYWTTPSKGTVLHVGVGNMSAAAQSAPVYSFAPGERLKRVISTDANATSKMASAWGEQANEEDKIHCWVFRSCAQLPGINIEAHKLEIRSPISLKGFDLIVNATGEEAVAEMLNETQINAERCFPPILHVWIKGNGETVQALWTDSQEFGCFRCLRFSAQDSRMQERFPVLKGDTEKSYRACQHYTPYAVSAPISAVALATDLIVDWLRAGDPSPRFRTRSVETADVYKVKNQNIRPLDGCPACAKK